MPCIPEYQQKIIELTEYIGEYANVLPYHPDNKRTSDILASKIFILKLEIDILVAEPKLKQHVATIYAYYLYMRDKWNAEEEY